MRDDIIERQIEASDLPPAPETKNPVAASLNILVSIPETIEIKMVDASTLSDYEVWFFISSVLTSAVVGFLVATLQALSAKQPAASLGWTTIVFFTLVVISVSMTFYKRNKLRKKARQIRLKVSGETSS